jgi:predicted glycosyltransferase
VSISQAGYNTALDVATSGARAVMVPFADEGQTEQAMRADRLAAHDLAIVVDERSLAPLTLARAVDDAGTRTRWGRWDFASDGARCTAELVSDLLGDRRRGTA